MGSRFSSLEDQKDRHKEEVYNIAAELCLADCYDVLRNWYRQNIDSAMAEAKTQNPISNYMVRSSRLIQALPPSSSVSELEIRRIVDEVIAGKLEWGYWRENDQAYMISYARAILAILGVEWGQYTESEKKQLQCSRLFPYLNDREFRRIIK